MAQHYHSITVALDAARVREPLHSIVDLVDLVNDETIFCETNSRRGVLYRYLSWMIGRYEVAELRYLLRNGVIVKEPGIGLAIAGIDRLLRFFAEEPQPYLITDWYRWNKVDLEREIATFHRELAKPPALPNPEGHFDDADTWAYAIGFLKSHRAVLQTAQSHGQCIAYGQDIHSTFWRDVSATIPVAIDEVPAEASSIEDVGHLFDGTRSCWALSKDASLKSMLQRLEGAYPFTALEYLHREFLVLAPEACTSAAQGIEDILQSIEGDPFAFSVCMGLRAQGNQSSNNQEELERDAQMIRHELSLPAQLPEPQGYGSDGDQWPYLIGFLRSHSAVLKHAIEHAKWVIYAQHIIES